MGVRSTVAAGVVGGVLVGALAGSLAVAWFHPQVDTGPIDNATKSLLVTAGVELRTVREAYSLSAVVSAPAVAKVMPTGAGQDARQVVSGKVHAAGDVIHYGDVVAEVSGRPVFAVPASLPLYRDLAEGSEGSDATGLQQLLTDIGLYSGTVGGKLGTASMAAVSKLYTRAGYAAPDPAVFPMADTAPIPADGLAVASVAQVGSELAEETNPLVSVVVSPAVVTARVDMLQAQVFTVGTTVAVRVGAADPVESTVTSVGEFQEGSDGSPSGYDITVALLEGVDPVAAAQSPVTVVETTDLPTGPAVPLTAIRRDSQGQTYVRLPPESGSPTPAPVRQVAVTVVSQSAGYAVIEENPELPVGTDVIIAGG